MFLERQIVSPAQTHNKIVAFKLTLQRFGWRSCITHQVSADYGCVFDYLTGRDYHVVTKHCAVDFRTAFYCYVVPQNGFSDFGVR